MSVTRSLVTRRWERVVWGRTHGSSRSPSPPPAADRWRRPLGPPDRRCFLEAGCNDNRGGQGLFEPFGHPTAELLAFSHAVLLEWDVVVVGQEVQGMVAGRPRPLQGRPSRLPALEAGQRDPPSSRPRPRSQSPSRGSSRVSASAPPVHQRLSSGQTWTKLDTFPIQQDPFPPPTTRPRLPGPPGFSTGPTRAGPARNVVENPALRFGPVVGTDVTGAPGIVSGPGVAPAATRPAGAARRRVDPHVAVALGGLSGCDCDWRISGAAAAVDGEGVDHERVGDHVEVLAVVAHGVGSAQPQGVVEGPVDGLGVAPTPVEPLEVRIGCSDGSDVLGAVEPSALVVGVAVQADGDGAAAQLGWTCGSTWPAEPWRVLPSILAFTSGPSRHTLRIEVSHAAPTTGR